MYIAMSMSMTYIQLIQQCTLAIWGGGVTLNFYQKNSKTVQISGSDFKFCTFLTSCKFYLDPLRDVQTYPNTFILFLTINITCCSVHFAMCMISGHSVAAIDSFDMPFTCKNIGGLARPTSCLRKERLAQFYVARVSPAHYSLSLIHIWRCRRRG